MLWKGAPKVSPHVSREPPRGASALRSRWKPPNSAAKPRIPHERQIHLAGDVPGPVGVMPRHGALRQPDCSQTGGAVDGPAAGIDYRSEEKDMSDAKWTPGPWSLTEQRCEGERTILIRRQWGGAFEPGAEGSDTYG